MGLSWVFELAGGHYQQLAGRTWHLVAWLEMLQVNEIVPAVHILDYHRLSDGLAEAPPAVGGWPLADWS